MEPKGSDAHTGDKADNPNADRTAGVENKQAQDNSPSDAEEAKTPPRDDKTGSAQQKNEDATDEPETDMAVKGAFGDRNAQTQRDTPSDKKIGDSRQDDQTDKPVPRRPVRLVLARGLNNTIRRDQPLVVSLKAIIGEAGRSLPQSLGGQVNLWFAPVVSAYPPHPDAHTSCTGPKAFGIFECRFSPDELGKLVIGIPYALKAAYLNAGNGAFRGRHESDLQRITCTSQTACSSSLINPSPKKPNPIPLVKVHVVVDYDGSTPAIDHAPAIAGDKTEITLIATATGKELRKTNGTITFSNLPERVKPPRCIAVKLVAKPADANTFAATCTFRTPDQPMDRIVLAQFNGDPATYTRKEPGTVRLVIRSKRPKQIAQHITDYLNTRNILLLGNGPNMDRRLARLHKRTRYLGGTVRARLGAALGGTGAAAFSMDLRTPLPVDLEVTNEALEFAVSMSRMGRIGDLTSDDPGETEQDQVAGNRRDTWLPMRFDFWIEGRIGRYGETGDHKGRFGVVYVGTDTLLTPNLLAGFMVQYDWIRADLKANTRIQGHGWMAGPYIAASAYGLALDLQARWGQSSNRITPVGTYTDTFDTTRWLLSGRLSGDFAYAGWTLRPGVSVQYIREKQSAYRDTPGSLIPAQTISQGDVRIGPRITYEFALDRWGTVIPSVKFEAVYRFKTAKVRDPNHTIIYTHPLAPLLRRLSGRVETGIEWRMKNGTVVSLSGTYDGIGADLQSVSASARLDMLF